MKKLLLLSILFCAVLLQSCEDPVADEYTPVNVVTGCLIVGDTIKGITVLKSQPITTKYDSTKSWIQDAQVTVTVNGNTIPLAFRVVNNNGEFFDPTGTLVQTKTTYKLSVKLKDGTTMTGETTTPDTLAWVLPPKPIMHFPSGADSIKLPSVDSLKLRWRSNDVGRYEYWISIKTLDTLEYGKYLTPATDEKNRRWGKNPYQFDQYQGETMQWGYLVFTEVPVVWAAFKWYGKQELKVWSMDKNMNEWSKLMQFSGSPKTYDNNQGSIKGGYGYFGSAYVIRGEAFIIKNQP